MYPSRPGLLMGFHGCEKSVRDSIVSGASMLKASENGYDWLGAGFYFWENNYDRALEFAQNPPGKKRFKVPSVLGAIIDLEYCLDLLDTRYLRNHIQICIKNPNCIKGFFIPREEVQWN